jgi:thiol-disulfide isomerase/thioredoxin
MSATPRMHTPLASLDPATEWINSEPLTAAGLSGKVVAVQFCTYSCINWIRTIPYARAWAERYRDDGLVVVGAHAPEFTFEQEIEGVRRALRAMGVEYPVVLDNEYRIWQAFDNHYWPALYVTDGEGRVRYDHFGEGAYEESERAIQELLGVDGDPVNVEASGIEAAADWETLGSPETYVGYARGERRAGDGTDALGLNQWALAGDWKVEDELGLLEAAGGSIRYRFEARDLNLVLTPPAPGAAVRFAVRLDGEPPGADRGADVDEAGNGAVDEPRLYQLVRQVGAVRERSFDITFLDPGVRAYVFTFG